MYQDDLEPSYLAARSAPIMGHSNLWSLVEKRNNGRCLPRDTVNAGRTLKKGSKSCLQRSSSIQLVFFDIIGTYTHDRSRQK